MTRLGRRAFLAAGAAALAAASGDAWAADDALLRKIIDTAGRKPEDKARDKYRHPYESLIFWGLKPGATVLEISPGSGWWTDIIAPYLAATGGHYIGGVGSSHRGGTYVNPFGGHSYGRHR